MGACRIIVLILGHRGDGTSLSTNVMRLNSLVAVRFEATVATAAYEGNTLRGGLIYILLLCTYYTVPSG